MSGKYDSNSSKFLFIVIHKYDTNQNQITTTIKDVFETKTESNFILSKTYKSKEENSQDKLYNMNITNYITTDGDIFQSKIEMGSSDHFEIKSDGYNVRKNFYKLVEIQNDECIFFYDFDNDENLKNVYWTKGSIFTYENGIGSSKNIIKYPNNEIPNEEIKNIILRFNFFSEYAQTVPAVAAPVPGPVPGPVAPVPGPVEVKAPEVKEKYDPFKNPKPTKTQLLRDIENQKRIASDNKIDKSTSILHKGGAVVNPDMIKLLNEKCKNINILYANTILPKTLNDLLNTLGKQQLDWLTTMKSIVKHLYINISAPQNLTNIEFYTELYKKMYSHYSANNIDLYKYNNELKKELKEFGTLKMNEYFKFMNGKNDDSGKPRFYDDTSFSVHVFDFADFLESNINSIGNLNDVINTILNNSSVKIEVNIKNIDAIKEKIEADSQKIYTYLQIKNFEHSNQSNFSQPRNERYNIKLDKKRRSMIMEYYDTNLPFYDETKKYTLNGEQLEKERPANFTVKRKNESALNEIEKITYDSKFIFGNFNKIFPPAISTREIADDLKNIVNKVKEGKPLFLMGWGTSGSGKTSSLISLNENGKITPGVIIYLCNQLCNELTNAQIKIEFVCKEIFEPYYDVENESYVKNKDEKSVSITSGPIVFSFNDSEEASKKIQLSKEYVHTAKHPYKLTTANWMTPGEEEQKEKTFVVGSTLGDVMQHLIDKDRLVKATPNNPNSSRSHILCFLKFTTGTDEKHIIFGDLAGVENKFNCNDTFEIGNFLSVKKQGTKQGFYKNEIDNQTNTFDPIYGGGDPHRFQDDESKNNFTKFINLPFFDFSNVFNLMYLYTGNLKNILPTGIKFLVNEILNRVFTNITTENLNEKILKKGSELLDVIRKYKEDSNFKSDSPLTFDDDIAKKMLPIKYGATNYNDTIKNVIDIEVQKAIKSEKGNSNAFISETEIKSYPGRNKFEQQEKQKVFNELWTKENINKLLNKIEDCITYNKIIQGACEHRKTEGVFINKSLAELTEDMVNIINHKNKNTVYFVPSIVDKCFPTYCPTQNKCFSVIHREDRPIELTSLIIDTVYKQLYPSNSGQLDKFADDIEFCIFGVFNWSRSANNPPPAPYVDINNLKQMFFEQDRKILKIDKFTEALASKISDLTKNKISTYALNKLIEIQTHFTKKDNNYYNSMLDKLKDIDNANAITAVGTIEFIDSIAKLNSISNSCFNPTIDKEYTDIYPKK